jgi:hypothetical protein
MKKLIVLSLLTILIGFGTTTYAATTQTSQAKVNFKLGFVDVPPLDPENPGNDLSSMNAVTPLNPDGTNGVTGTGGTLSIDFASGLAFGQQIISSKDETYYAHPQILNGRAPSALYVQVTDQRNTHTGWTLSVQTDGQFHLPGVDPRSYSTGSARVGDFLEGAYLNFKQASVNSFTSTPSSEYPAYIRGNSVINEAQTVILAAQAGSGNSTFDLHFGKSNMYDMSATSENAVANNSPISLTVPATAAVKQGVYTANLIWTLSDVPGNTTY